MITGNGDVLRDYLAAITAFVPEDPQQKRYLIVAVGTPFINTKGEYDHRNWFETPFEWPARTDEAVAHIQFHTTAVDVFVCPYLQKTTERAEGNAAWRQIIHNDVDNSLDLAKVRKIGGFVVWSGSEGHAHVYVPLKHTVTWEQHKRLEEGLRDYLNGDAKIRDNDLLRPPGSFNHKPRVFDGKPPALVKAEKP